MMTFVCSVCGARMRTGDILFLATVHYHVKGCSHVGIWEPVIGMQMRRVVDRRPRKVEQP